MTRLSVMDCASEGFSLIRRRPWTFVGWVVFWLVLGVAPLLIAIAGVAPKFSELMNAIQGAHDEHDPVALQHIVNFELGLWSVMAPWYLWLTVVGTVLYAAVYRAVLEPRKSGFAYLRLGMDEVRLFFTSIAVVLLMTAFVSLVVAGAVGLFVLSDNVIGHPWEGWIDALVVVLATFLIFWVGFRLALALPMTFAEKHIRIFESWRLTRGNFWPLVGIALMSFVFAIVVLIGFSFLRSFVFLAVGLSTGAFDQLGAMTRIGDDLRKGLPAIIAAFGPAFIALFVIQAIADAVIRVVFIAPYARAYAELTGADAPAEQGI